MSHRSQFIFLTLLAMLLAACAGEGAEPQAPATAATPTAPSLSVPTTTALVSPTATSPVPPKNTPVSVSKTLATTLSLSAPGGSQQVSGTLKDQASVPIARASIEFAMTALDGPGLFAQYTLTGTVPAGATQADVGFRVNTECGCAGTSELILYETTYVQGGEKTNRVLNSNFAQGLNGWGFWGTGTARLETSDQGQGQMLHVTAKPSQTAAINSTRFPVSAGAAYTLTLSARVSPVSTGSGYFDIIFLNSSNEGTRKQIPLKTATVGLATRSPTTMVPFALPRASSRQASSFWMPGISAIGSICQRLLAQLYWDRRLHRHTSNSSAI